MMICGRFLACGVLLALAAGCRDGQSSDVGGCPVAQTSCNIADASCQSAVLELTACIRGDAKPPLPKIRSITQAQFHSELLAEAKKAGTMATPYDSALATLHLLPSDKTSVDASVDAQTQGVAAYYDDQAKNITVIKGAVPSDPVIGMYELSHELTHYLQDREGNLARQDKRKVRDFDAHIALHALIEGEAVTTSTRVLLSLMHHLPEELDWNGYFDQMQGSLLADISRSDAPLEATGLELPYSVGGRYVATVWNETDRAYVDDLFDQPPLALVDWLHGYGHGAPKPTLLQPLDCAPPLAPDGFSLYGLDSLGAAGALALLSAAGTQDLALASLLRADAIAVYTTANADDATSAPLLVAWRLRFSDASSARNFANHLTKLDVTTQTFGQEVTVSARNNANDNPLALDSCPKLDELKPIDTSSAPMALHRRLVH